MKLLFYWTNLVDITQLLRKLWELLTEMTIDIKSIKAIHWIIHVRMHEWKKKYCGLTSFTCQSDMWLKECEKYKYLIHTWLLLWQATCLHYLCIEKFSNKSYKNIIANSRTALPLKPQYLWIVLALEVTGVIMRTRISIKMVIFSIN